ncbi:AAA family ATPase [Nocardia sp. NPDC056000]|uniref:helix-turn-helix transcriptional regulator n=1 Tax=Nocardia sp. NPDC056000 TaxID=3345674 RepID=UPI0035DB073C
MSVGPDPFGVGMPMGTDGFIGRDSELDRVTTLLAGSARLVTLVGPGGIGKTRLAMAIAAQLRADPRLPVYWVHLARLPRDASAAVVMDEIAGAVLEGDFSGRTGRQALIDALERPAGPADMDEAARRTVVVLDNCEHLLAAAGLVIADLLGTIPGLSVLATSRTAIGWAEEHIAVVPPLAWNQAMTLFRQRAELSGRPVGEGDTAVVRQICWHLHYFPLYIRLAAARLRYQSPAMVLRDLGGAEADRRLRWSPGFRVGVDERHRDIGAVIGWSYELCEPKERLLFARLAVFATGYDADRDGGDRDGGSASETGADIEAIESVCAGADSGGLERYEIADLLEQLVDRSLVSIHLGGETARFSLLESFQVFARERLIESGEWLELTARHRDYYRDQVLAVSTGWVSPREQELLVRTRAAWDNILCAVEGSLADPDRAVIGLEMAVGLATSRIPFLRGSLRESRSLIERALSAACASGHCPPELEVSTRALIGWLSLCQGLPGEAEQILTECVAASLPDGIRPDVLDDSGTAEIGSDRMHSTADRDSAMVTGSDRLDPAVDHGLPAAVEYLWGGTLWLVHADPVAAVVLSRAVDKFEAAGDPGGAAMSGLFEALSAAFHGTAEQALAVTGAQSERMVAAGAQWAITWARFARAIAVCAHGDPKAALALCDAGLAWQIPMRDHWGGVWGLHIRAWILSRLITALPSALDARAVPWALDIARLLGGTAELRRRLGFEVANLRPFAEITAEAVEVATKVLGDRAFRTVASEGAAIPDAGRLLAACSDTDHLAQPGMPALESAHRFTNSLESTPATASEPNPSPEHARAWSALTSAEQQVATLVAAGFTNAAIAARRGTSVRTVDSQVASILSKLMINSRRDIRPPFQRR